MVGIPLLTAARKRELRVWIYLDISLHRPRLQNLVENLLNSTRFRVRSKEGSSSTTISESESVMTPACATSWDFPVPKQPRSMTSADSILSPSGNYGAVHDVDRLMAGEKDSADINSALCICMSDFSCDRTNANLDLHEAPCSSAGHRCHDAIPAAAEAYPSNLPLRSCFGVHADSSASSRATSIPHLELESATQRPYDCNSGRRTNKLSALQHFDFKLSVSCEMCQFACFFADSQASLAQNDYRCSIVAYRAHASFDATTRSAECSRENEDVSSDYGR